MKTERALTAEKLAFASQMLRLLGHPVRLSIVELLADAGERSVGAIGEAVGEPQPTVSAHLNRMRVGGLLASRREGTTVYYQVALPQLHKLLDCLRDCEL